MLVIPTGVALPAVLGAPDEPPHALYVGRLSEEKGVRELAAAADGLPLVVVGDGPLRPLFPNATGFVPPSEIGTYYERAAVVVVPSRREGYGMVAREAMAHGRPVVATAVGGLVDVVEDGVTGVLVRPRDSAVLRREVRRLLDDAGLRARLGAAARDRAREQCSWDAHVQHLCDAWRLAARADSRREIDSRQRIEGLARASPRVRLRASRACGTEAVRGTLARPGRIRARRGSRARPTISPGQATERFPNGARVSRPRQSTRQRSSVRSTRSPSIAVSFLPSSRERAAYVIGTS